MTELPARMQVAQTSLQMRRRDGRMAGSSLRRAVHCQTGCQRECCILASPMSPGTTAGYAGPPRKQPRLMGQDGIVPGSGE